PQKRRERIDVVYLPLIVSGDFLIIRIQDDVERKLRALEPLDEQVAVFFRASSGLLDFGRHFVGEKLDYDVLVEQLLDFRLREHTVLVDGAVRSGNAGEVDEDQLSLVARLRESFRQAAKAAFLQIRQQEGIEPGENRPGRPLLLVGVYSEQRRGQINTETEKQDAHNQARDTDMLRRVIMRQAEQAEQIQSTREAQRHVHAKRQVIGEKL